MTPSSSPPQPYYHTSERKPTKEDANENRIISYWTGKSWAPVGWESVAEIPDNYPIWTHQPASPKSREEEAFDEWVKTYPGKWDNLSLRAAWLAALAFAVGQKEEK